MILVIRVRWGNGCKEIPLGGFMNTEKYFEMIKKKVDEQFEIGNRARAVGIDPVSKVEVPIATTLAEKAVGLISVVYPQLDDKVVKRILELEEEYGVLDTAVAFKIAEEVAKEKFCKFESLLQAIEVGIRVGFAYITLGVVSSPIEGFTELKLGKTREGKEYFKVLFSGPIRSAGTTASCVVLMLIDYLRESFGFAKYDPSEDEINRYVTENFDYHERVTNLQYMPSEEEIKFLAKNLPIQIDGEPTSDREVSNYKDLPRVDSSLIRGGMCLIFSEGLAQKAQKGLRLLRGVQAKGFKASSWEFLDEYIEKFKLTSNEESEKDTKPVYIKDLVAGRPVFSHPSRSGGFRFRYGRSRASGFSSVSVHPATMAISGGFMSAGTQLKVEKPTKGCVISACSELDGPIVRLKDGSVLKLDDANEAKRIYNNVGEIIYLGDILFSLGDVVNRNYELLKPGYVEEWWELELNKRGGSIMDKFKVGFDEAVEISRKHDMALYPKFIFYWKEITYEEFLGLVDWIGHGVLRDAKLILPYGKDDKERFVKGKRALELIGCEHGVSIENVILEEGKGRVLLFNLGIDVNEIEEGLRKISEKIKDLKKGELKSSLSKSLGIGKINVLEVVNGLCELEIKDKSGTFIGARMGRPEKAKLRKLTGSPHVLFPVGVEGGRLRSFQAAIDVGSVKGKFPNFYCESCKKDNVYRNCISCGESCKRVEDENEYGERRIDIREYFESAKKMSGVRIEDIPIVKGVRGTSNKDHSCEHLAKGMLRAKYGLNVNKDGTIRYDMTEMVLTHFKPLEIRTSVERLKELGYDKDINGNALERDDQVLELMPHDVVLPSCPDGLDEKADDVFVRICNFIDDELKRLYGLDKFFNLEKKTDLLGALVVCIAPHICTATVGRIIGFSKTQGFLASPFMHAAMRRDADGDECAAMLLMDLLLNFSRSFLPAHRGGTQDAPLVLNSRIRAGDVDDQILDFEMGKYGLELYEKAEQKKHSSEVKFDSVKERLKKGENVFEGMQFTHGCDDINLGVVNSAYKILPTMDEKVEHQMALCKKIRAVDTSDVARLTIERHFIRDTRGNLRKFSMQVFRCVGCNSKYRRPPLMGKCTKCGGKLIFTISEGSILKYMQKSLDLAKEYEVSPYLSESLELTEMYIHSIFGKDPEKQEQISKWF
jgi:DNA polymerase II large subunit